MDLRETYNKIARDWNKDHAADDWWVRGAAAFADLLPHCGSVLDVGCGTGNKTKYLAGRGFEVTGIDFAEGMLAIAREAVPEARFLAMDARDIGSLDGTFDGIFMEAFILHIPKREAGELVRLAAEKLAQGGFFYISAKEIRPGQPGEGVRTEDNYGYPYERFFSYYTSEELAAHLKNAGCEVSYEDVFPSGKTRWLQLIGRKR